MINKVSYFFAASCVLLQLDVRANDNLKNLSNSSEELPATQVINLASDSYSESEQSSDQNVKDDDDLTIEILGVDYVFVIEEDLCQTTKDRSVGIKLFLQNDELKELIPVAESLTDNLLFERFITPLIKNPSVKESIDACKNEELDSICLSFIDEITEELLASIDCVLNKDSTLYDLSYLNKAELEIEDDDVLAKKYFKRKRQSITSAEEFNNDEMPSKKADIE